MTFVDTSAVYAWVNPNDPEHSRAVQILADLLRRNEPLLTHNYVVVEALAVLQRRVGLAAALEASRDMNRFEIEWITRAVHEDAVRRLERTDQRHVSLVDCVSFIVMRQRGIDTAFAFVPHFEAEGFRLYDSPRE